MSQSEIYDLFAAMLQRFFMNKIHSPVEADDLLHETFTRLFEARRDGRFDESTAKDPVAATRRFVFGIAHKLLLEFWREKRRKGQHEDIGVYSIAALDPGMSTEVSRVEKTVLLREALRRIPLNYQIVLELYYWEKVRFEEISALLGVPRNTAYTWAKRGKEELGRELERLFEADRASVGFEPYPWYDRDSGEINLIKLAEAAMIGVRPRPSLVDVPPWITDLNLPARRPGAQDWWLARIAKDAWEAWIGAGRPMPKTD